MLWKLNRGLIQFTYLARDQDLAIEQR